MTAGNPSSLVSSVQWVQGVLSGPAATAVAVIAVATLGVMMLIGRASARRGVSVIIGCFIVFSSTLIAQGLIVGMVATTSEPAEMTQIQRYSPTNPEALDKAPFNPFDPYAGASTPQHEPEELPSIR